MEKIAEQKSFGGLHQRYRHVSETVHCEMVFAVYLPPAAKEGNACPVLYWLSGLTCTDENFMQKAGAHRMAAELGLIIVAPDTSPRGKEVPGDPDGAWDFGHGAGFYLNATQEPWRTHYQMHDYVVQELPTLIETKLPFSGRRGISGHSMGGHGALVAALRHPMRYQSISAFAPISNPMQCPWGEKAFSRYLSNNRSSWRQWDACELMAQSSANKPGDRVPILIDQGEADNFLQEQLKPEALEQAAAKHGYPLTLRRQPGYDHSYYFIASFIDDHLRYHAACLGNAD